MQSCATRQKNKCYDSSVQVWTMDLLICYSFSLGYPAMSRVIRAG